MSSTLLAAIYASALPFIAHDPVLFVVFEQSIGDQLWEFVLESIKTDLKYPKLAVVQASMLYLQQLPPLSQRSLSDTASRLSFYASTVAVAMSLGLHLEPRPWGIPASEKRLRRRLWWAVYMEDKWTSLLAGRPPLIRAEEWDIFDLDETDFETDYASNGRSALDTDPTSMNVIFRQSLKLSQLVERVHQTF